MRKLLKALPIAVGLPLILFSASVGPEDAASNISKWARLIHVDHLPGWLSEKGGDIRVAVIFSVIYIIAIWVVPKIQNDLATTALDRQRRRKLAALIGMIASGASLAAFSAVYFWPSGRQKKSEPSASLSNLSDIITGRQQLREYLSSEETLGPLFDYYLSDNDKYGLISASGVINAEVTLTDNNKLKFPILYTLFFDFNSNIYYASVYVPAIGNGEAAFLSCKLVAEVHAKIFQNFLDKVHMAVPFPDRQSPGLSDKTKFSGRIFLYHENSQARI